MHENQYHIITDEPVVAMIDLFEVTPNTKPRWLRVVSDPATILALPNGSKCRAQWYSPRGRTLADRAWRERRLAGGLDFISEDDEAWILANLKTVEPPAAPIRRPEPELQNMILTQRWK